MKVEFTCRNCEASDKLREVTEQKLSKLEKYFDKEPTVKVCFKKQAKSLTTEIMLDYMGRFVRAAAVSDNFYDNIDVILPKLEGQIRKHRTRFDRHNKNLAYRDQALYHGSDEEESPKIVVREKIFKLTPMTVEEAKDEIELIGHDFYVFLEAKTNTVQVIYRRNDGDFGLIEPEI